MNRYRVSRRAEADLEAIDEYVAATFGNAVAERVTERLFETFSMLADQPGIGTRRPAWTNEDVLFFVVAGTPSVVIYRRTEPLQILRIWHGRQDPESLETR